MSFKLIGAARRTRLIAVGLVATTAAVATLVVGQAGVIGAEDDSKGSAEFTVAGDGSLPTKRPALGDAREPLSTGETGYAVHIATTDASVPAGATDVRGKAGPQVLYADIPDADVDAGGRRALVVLYDYSDNKAYHQLVDLKAGAVTRSKSAVKLQPPTAADEADAAMEIAISAVKPPRFVADFEKTEGMPLVSPEQINYVAAAWSYNGTTVGGKECGTERCARLMVSTAAGTYLNSTDFAVNLSAKRLVALERP